jgi:hypothetical protein
MPKDRSESAPARFKRGDKVRVKRGVPDPNFPDIPLGGWAGTVEEVDRPEGETTVLVAWNRTTLRDMHPIYKKRCERDGLELESMWLGEEDLEPDDGAPVALEQPTSIVTSALSEDDEDDRIRMALGLTHDDPLPDVTEETLLAYHRYLVSHLNFPIPVAVWVKTGAFTEKKVTLALTGLAAAPEGEIDDEEEFGLIGLGRTPDGETIEVPLDDVEAGKKDQNLRLLDDYSSWLHNYR